MNKSNNNEVDNIKLINIKGNDSIAAVAKTMKDDEEVEDISDIDVEDGTIIE